MEAVQTFFVAIFSATSIWSVVARAVLWFVISAVIIMSTDSINPEQTNDKIRHNLGFLLLFLVLSSGLMFLLFSYTPSSASG